MLVEGKKIARAISVDVATRVEKAITSPCMAVITCDPNFETQKYLDLKKNKAVTFGITLEVITLPDDASTEAAVKAVKTAAKFFDGVIVQLPLPAAIDAVEVLAAVPVNRDVDAFSYQHEECKILPPVVGAIDEISKLHQIEWENKKVVIFGAGKLVGLPTAFYANKKGSKVTVVTKETTDYLDSTKEADIIVLGVGQPNLLTKEMIKAGVVIFDAGASEDGGLLVGDAASDVVEKAALLTPVPGGIGPITIALLFRNLLDLKGI